MGLRNRKDVSVHVNTAEPNRNTKIEVEARTVEAVAQDSATKPWFKAKLRYLATKRFVFSKSLLPFFSFWCVQIY